MGEHGHQKVAAYEGGYSMRRRLGLTNGTVASPSLEEIKQRSEDTQLIGEGVPTNQRERIRMLRRIASRVLEDEGAARRWMRSEVKAIGGLRPIDVGKTASGYQEVRAILGRIEYGVYS
jgi:putative toxin-antitoxin system antitoxin component (TIGR02293 family)